MLSLFDHLDEGVLLIDSEDTIRWLSNPGHRILGSSSVRRERRLSGNLFPLPAEPTFPELEIHAVDNRNDEQAEDGILRAIASACS